MYVTRASAGRLGWCLAAFGAVVSTVSAIACTKSKPPTSGPTDAFSSDLGDAQEAPRGNADGANEAVPEDGVEVLYPTLRYTPPAVYVDDRYVYWADNPSSVYRAPKGGGGKPEAIGEWGGAPAAELFASDEAYLYWITDGAVRRFSKADGKITDLSLGGDSWAILRASGGGLYVAKHGCLSVGRLKKDGSDLQILDVASARFGGGATVLTTWAGRVYCANIGRLHVIDLDRRTERLVFELERPSKVAALNVVGDTLYWMKMVLAANQAKEFIRMPLPDGPQEKLFTGADGISEIISYDERRNTLFWISGIFGVEFFNVGTGQHGVIAEKRLTSRGFAADEDFFYWTELGGAVVRLRKP